MERLIVDPRWTTCRRSSSVYLVLIASVLLRVAAQTAEPMVEKIDLPPLKVHGQPAHAHTQGLELIDGHCYVTARRDDIRPKRALLLRTAPGKADWEVWDITPANGETNDATLDHPGGFQLDGERLWIPLAESRRNGSSIIRVFALTKIVAGEPLQSEFEFSLDDHIGALAVDRERGLVLGASWDTETVYVWNIKGQLQRTLTGAALKARGLGVSRVDTSHAGIAVQDWKYTGHHLIASGLFRGPTSDSNDSKSWLVRFNRFLDPKFRTRVVALPSPEGIELANEGMTLSDGAVYFLPEDLSETNHLFRARLVDLFP